MNENMQQRFQKAAETHRVNIQKAYSIAWK